MTDIVVIRGLGDREGDDIIDALLSTEAPALSRGRAELDERATAKVTRDITVPYESGIELGQLARVQDPLQGETYSGKIIDIAVVFRGGANPTATMTLTLLVPTDFYV